MYCTRNFEAGVSDFILKSFAVCEKGVESIELIWTIALENGDSGGRVVPKFEEKLDSRARESGANKYSVKYCFS